MKPKTHNSAIQGEYYRVAFNIEHKDDLQKAYYTPISETEAEYLIKRYSPKTDVLFYPDIRATANDSSGYLYIRLPNNPLTEEDIKNEVNYPRLTLGVVIHELSHVLAGLYYGHGPKFVEELERLTSETRENRFRELIEEEINSQNSKKKIAKSISRIIESKCPTCHKEVKIKSSFEDLNFIYHSLECNHLIKVEKVQEKSPADNFQSVTGDKLYSFQKENVLKFKEANGKLCIFDEMGLGKTPSSIAIAYSYDLFPVLVICKSGLRHQWKKMIEHWGNEIDDLGISRVKVQIIENSKSHCLKGMNFYVVSYDLLPLLKPDFFKKMRNGKNQDVPLQIRYCIIDECQQIKNMEAQRTRATAEVCKDIPNLAFLSGTPIKNNAIEFYPTLHMCDPNRFRSKAGFASEFVDTYLKGPYIKYGGIRNYEKFKSVTDKFIIRHTQAEVLPELPDITRNFVFTEMSGQSARDYADIAKEFSDFYYGAQKEDAQFFQNILAFFNRMRHVTGLAKVDDVVDYAIDFLESTDRKLAIFTHHIDVREEIVKKLDAYLKEQELKPCLELIGNMDGDSKEALKEKFNFDKQYRILVASTLASGEGHNLQHDCSDCIFVERQWNPANEEQAEFRFKRPGQKASVINATYLVAEETIDEYLTKIVEDKRINNRYSMDGTAKDWKQNQILMDLANIIATRGYKR